MNKTYLCVLPLTLFLAASSGYGVAQETECLEEPATTPECEGDPNAPMVNLNLNKMEANPRCVNVYPGTTILFRLTPKKDLEHDTVEILPKDSFDSWLQGKNDTFDDIIIITVPGVYEPDEERTGERVQSEHKYSIKAPGKCLDPRVHVEH